MTVPDFPLDTSFQSCQFTLVSANTKFESPSSGYMQVRNNNNQHWEASYTLRLMKADSEECAAWQSFLFALDGQYGRFLGYDPSRKSAKGIATGSPVVDGANQTGNKLNIKGCTPLITMYKAGDPVEFGGEYKRWVYDVLTDAAGKATGEFRPAIRKSPNDNAPLTHTNPKCLMMLNQDNVSYDVGVDGFASIQFTAREAFEYKQYLLTEDGDYLTTEAGERIIL